jgi:signal transduction histidine kinase
MKARMDKTLLLGVAVVLVVAALGLASSSHWVGKPFPGFLLLGNRVVASAGLQHWPAVTDGKIFQREVVAVNKRPVGSASEIHELVSGLPAGTALTYAMRAGDSVSDVVVETRIFKPADFFLLFGTYALVGIGLCSVALVIRYVKPTDAVANGSALGLYIIGLWGLSATDLYGPYRMFRLHAALECFLFAGLTHFALVFPYRRRFVERTPWLIPAVYGSAAVLALVCEVGLFTPDLYVQVHRIAVGAFAVSLVLVTGAEAHAYFRPPSAEAKQRVKVLAAGTALAALPGVAVMAGSALSGGQSPENLMGWGGIMFPLAIGYAVLKDDLLGLSSIVRGALLWAVLTVVVGLGYAAVLAGIDLLMSDVSGISRWLLVAAFAGISTGLMLPLRNQLQSVVDRLFFRSTYDFRVLLEESSDRFASLSSRDELTDFVVALVSYTLQPTWVEMVVREPEDDGVSLRELSSRLTSTELSGLESVQQMTPLEGGGLVVQFATGLRVVGILAMGTRKSGREYSGEDLRLLQTLANQGAVAFENALAVEGLKDLNRNRESRVDERTAELATTLSELKEAEVHLVQAERLAAVGELSAGVAHEVNNPLNFARNSLATLRTYVEDVREVASLMAGLDGTLSTEEVARQLAVLEKKKAELQFDGMADDLGELVEIVTEGLDRTAKLVTDLRDFAAPGNVGGRAFDVAEGMRSTLQLVGHQLRDSGCQVEADLTPGLATVEGDPGALNQVFLNVLKNAADAIEGTGSGTIAVAVFEEGSEVVVRVRDDGTGMDSETKSRLFEPFFTTKEAGAGTGLGLSMCRRIVDEHGGRIEVESEPGAGTTITVSLPSAGVA